MFEPHSITGKFRQMGLSPESILLLLLIAILKTALSEEIFFRGFVAKRLIGLLGYQKGNVLQAALFGGIHAALFALTTSKAFFLAMIFLIPGLGAYVSAFLNERLAQGSIMPGWISHGLANVIAYSMFGFVL